MTLGQLIHFTINLNWLIPIRVIITPIFRVLLKILSETKGWHMHLPDQWGMFKVLS